MTTVNETTAAATEKATEVKAPAINAKQQVAINNVVSGISLDRAELGDNAPKFEAMLEGGNVYLVADNWPTIKIGKEGGINIEALRSYADPLHAAVHADELVKKQADNDQKKTDKEAAAVAKAAAPAAVAEKESFETGEPVAA